MPAGDVTLFIAAHWQQHVRYVARHIGQAITRQVSCLKALNKVLVEASKMLRSFI